MWNFEGAIHLNLHAKSHTLKSYQMEDFFFIQTLKESSFLFSG